MATAMKCDRCGKFYEKNYEKTDGGTPIRGVAFTIHYNHSTFDRVDLCDECIAKLKGFLYGCCEFKEEE